MKVPFLDLDAQYEAIKPEVQQAISEVLESKKFIQGEYAETFAQDFLKVHGADYGVGCSNGTSAITLALRALNIGPGDEIITVANTFFATVEAIAEVGAKVILVDCEPGNYLINIDQVAEVITDKTKAVIPVHLYGNPVDMERLVELCRPKGIHLIEDSAQAHLATFNGQAVGTFGDAGTFSFYPGKNLGAYGDAGFVTCRDEELTNKVAMHLNHGRTKKYEHDFLAGNYRMDGIQAAILSVKTKYIDQWTNQRIAAGDYYDQKLKAHGFKVIEKDERAKCVHHLYVVETGNREEVMQSLKDVGISTGIHYPIPMNLQPACKDLGYGEGSFPVAERTCERIVSLPIFPEITREQQDYVVEEFLKVAQI